MPVLQAALKFCLMSVDPKLRFADAEVARLREELAATKRNDDDMTEQRNRLTAKLFAAEARVAKLERERDVLLEKWQAKTTDLVTALDAIDQARGLLERMPEPGEYISFELRDAFEAWLRANPSPPPLPRRGRRAHCGDHAGWRSDCDRCAELCLETGE